MFFDKKYSADKYEFYRTFTSESGFLNALPIDSDNYDDLIIDLRFHYLKTGYLPSMDCWHLDFFSPEEKDNEVYLCCLGDCSLTEVLVSTVEVSDINPNDNPTFERWDSEIENQSYSSVVVSPSNIYQYTPQTFHKGTPATHDGIRIFMRACCLPTVKHANESPKHALYWELGEKGRAKKALCVRG